LSIAAAFAALHIKSSDCHTRSRWQIIYSSLVEHYVAGLTAGSVKG